MNAYLVKLILLLIFFVSNTAAAQYKYEKRIQNKHVLHIVQLDLNEYQPYLIRANDGEGRETVQSIAQRYKASIAINGGFFLMGGSSDGLPTGTLVIKGDIYKLRKSMQSLLLINDGKIQIKRAVDSNEHKTNQSMLAGIPLLLNQHKIPKRLYKQRTDFFNKAHARTAIGITKKNQIIIVVAEHHYLRDITTMSLGELYSILNEKGPNWAEKHGKKSPNDLSMSEIKSFIKEEFAPQDGVMGLSILELAKLMQQLGCESALNLDGGGSSSLWINGKIANQIIGDEDESDGIAIIRPVSDAVIFTKRN